MSVMGASAEKRHGGKTPRKIDIPKCAGAIAPGHKTGEAADAAVQGGNCFKNCCSSGAAL